MDSFSAVTRHNVGRFQKDDVVRHRRRGTIYVVLGWRAQSECINVFNTKSRKREIVHPRFLDHVQEEMLVLAAFAALD